ncbi:hypothetical protein SISSUDRAFT_1063554 [Sistotremastrum suecicum HHB10207 ss-3]|uniref:Uncharacterized protein n=1 Tax=Sistotremastrum suecicum HHB10207 ss-3 TaxID=1314776 RepID=A0A166BMA4_9AGAM|nr:hypothetical protein SISSUDRAFT_1063554 [Sistotremastrum suecicum HHB10207 ss-3]
MQLKQYTFTALATAVVFATTALAAANPEPTFSERPCPKPPAAWYEPLLYQVAES